MPLIIPWPTPARPPSPRPPSLENNALIGRLAIPRLNLNTTVREGTSEGTLVLAAGHIPGTALPGGNGNVGVAGHRDTLFRNLAGIRKNDLIQFETPHGNYKYYVASIEIVAPEDVRVLRPSPHSELTLVTCYPFDYLGSAPERFVVKARQMPGSPLPGNPGKTFRQAPPEKPEPAGTDLPAGTAVFHIGKRRSQQLAPGISLALTIGRGQRPDGRLDVDHAGSTHHLAEGSRRTTAAHLLPEWEETYTKNYYGHSWFGDGISAWPGTQRMLAQNLARRQFAEMW